MYIQVNILKKMGYIKKKRTINGANLMSLISVCCTCFKEKLSLAALKPNA